MKEIPLLKVRQWLPEWEQVQKFGQDLRRKPDPHFYVGAVPAKVLRELSGVLKRTTEARENNQPDLGIQRRHDEERSAEIASYLQGGFPWSTLGTKQQDSLFDDIRMPGWLPTAIVANVKLPEDDQSERRVAEGEHCTIVENGLSAVLRLPSEYVLGVWEPSLGFPLEIIDGQHRLMAFGRDVPDDFDLPVVVFNGLDLSWQAYLFYVINIKPKKINPSLAYDLYPLLRSEDWLERIDGPKVYRESRAQEIVEFLWRYEGSPFYRRLNLLGEPGSPYLKQATVVRSLVATLMRPGDRVAVKNRGGFFGCLDRERRGWSRIQQCAFLTRALADLFMRIKETAPSWLSDLTGDEPLFDKTSLLNTDQGIRAYLHVLNDLMISGWEQHKASGWVFGSDDASPSDELINEAVRALSDMQPLASFVGELNQNLVAFKWLSSDNSNLQPQEQRQRMAYKGSSGYGVLREDVLAHLSALEGRIAELAQGLRMETE